AGHGPVRIVASQTIAEHLMPTFLASLAAELPDVPATFEVENTAGVISALRRARADLGVVAGGAGPSALGSRAIGPDQLAAVVAPTHPWAVDESIRAAGIDAEQLAAAALIVREEGSGTRAVLATALEPRPVAEPSMVLHSNAAVRTAVAGGAGCALLSELVVAADLREGRLVRIPVRGVNLRRSLRAVWDGPPPERLEPSLRALRGATARGW